jgi:cytochrome bd-type quinol oxidase subunit 2
VAYVLLGSTWLIMKTEGPLQRRMFDLARPVTVVLLLVIIGIASLWTPLTHPNVAAGWFALPNLVFFAPIPVPSGPWPGRPCDALSAGEWRPVMQAGRTPVRPI